MQDLFKAGDGRTWDIYPVMFALPRLRVIAAFLGLTLGAALPLAAQRTLTDLPYVTGGVEHQRLDLYLPANAPGGPAHPLVVSVHGGGWEGGSKHDCPARGLVGRGYVVASVEYRFSQQAIFPAQIEDVKAAVRWLRAHAAEYGIDPQRVGAVGESAGGHLVALLGTTGHDRRFDVGENLDQPSAVQCVVDRYGPADFLHWGDAVDPTLDTPTNSVAHLLGGTVAMHADAAKLASPVTFVDKGSAPFFILHGDKDPRVPVQQSRELDAALRKAGVESTLVVLPGAVHGGPAFGTPEVTRQVVEFLDRHLGASR